MQTKAKFPDHAAIRDELIALIASDRLVLPGIPEAAHRVRQAATQPHASLAEIADLAAQDPTLAAHLIKVSNSVALRRGDQIHGLRAAVTRLGARLTAVSATSFAILQMVAMAPRHVDRLRALYRHSIDVGERCYMQAHQFPHLSPEDALLTGLVHNIGTAVVLQYTRGKPRLQAPAVLDALIQDVQASAGAELLRSWRFPPHIRDAVANHENWYRGKPADAPDYADLLIAAKADIYRDTDHPLAILAAEPLPAFARLKLDPSAPARSFVTAEDAVRDVQEFCGLSSAK
jgi:HD-like signal output (HDOD) protein